MRVTVPSGTVSVKGWAEVFLEILLGEISSEERGWKERRREEILVAALEVLEERGYREASMREVAARARASKETLYSWFGSKSGLFEALISWQAERIDAALSRSLEGYGEDPAGVLRSFAVELSRLLLGERAVIINRAAISEAHADPSLARILAARGRESVTPRLARYLEAQKNAGTLDFPDAGTAVETLIGLTITDRQVRRLLGTLPEPDERELQSRAQRAVDDFIKLYAPGRS